VFVLFLRNLVLRVFVLGVHAILWAEFGLSLAAPTAATSASSKLSLPWRCDLKYHHAPKREAWIRYFGHKPRIDLR
jgi:hypothetical protein